ncbi:hypothetical protein UFOVP1492_50 [uncultured Caudovirales phage]|uniref:Uncharacterized protein n=1 Tax=uncultured Caudovirales phage TaxID=2100421 RepID=A0A6J7XLJ0_9CAUD|nr:hypothetical protein UFOVP1242_126 [uncultured Caudovirales phage]CAB4217612.1 hypothetical protein UFOVP1492_50 [uncultured Caudovirales phage]CAB5231427.1 hypothetical protein UFOVP1580_79 [uncultured Caudovirales phage]
MSNKLEIGFAGEPITQETQIVEQTAPPAFKLVPVRIRKGLAMYEGNLNGDFGLAEFSEDPALPRIHGVSYLKQKPNCLYVEALNPRMAQLKLVKLATK